MTSVGLLPAALGCLISALRWRRPETDESLSELHR
jgi:hypothetical protein